MSRTKKQITGALVGTLIVSSLLSSCVSHTGTAANKIDAYQTGNELTQIGDESSSNSLKIEMATDSLSDSKPRKTFTVAKNGKRIMTMREIDSEESKKPKKRLRVSETIDKANDESRRNPDFESYHNAVVTYTYEENALFSIYTAPRKITDIIFQKGETIESVSAGDTKNFIVSHSVAGNTPHLLIKPLHSGLVTNLTVLTDKRAYYFYLKSWKNTFMAGCRFYYPEDEILRKELLNRQTIGKFQVDDLNFDWEIESSCSDCTRPLSVFADPKKSGKLFLIMPKAIKHKDLPALFAIDSEGKGTMINYRFVDEHKFVLDSLYSRLVLQYGGKNREVYIFRSGQKPKTGFGLFLNRLFGSNNNSDSDNDVTE